MALLMVTILALLASSSIILSYNGVYGEKEEEAYELERQLKHLNKPAIRSIKTEHGEIYDCVDFYKQPAFDNPLLKNHKPEMRPSVPREILKNVSSGVDALDYLRLEGGGCPSGTVPIRRTTKEDLIRWKSYSNTTSNFHQFLDMGLGKTYAGFQLKDEGLKYHGGSMGMSVNNPSLNSDNQYSAAMIWAQNGLNHVQVGWHVNPKLYGDRLTHFFGLWTVSGTPKTGCYNRLCNGFVQVNKEVTLGQPFHRTSTYNVDVVDMIVYLHQDIRNGNWWVSVGEKGTNVGYWPKELFNTIRESAPVVGWRGEIYTPEGEKSPEMGTGASPSPFGIPEYIKTAYFRAARVNGDDNIARGPNDDSLEDVSNGKPCYKAFDFPYIDDYYRHTFFYGGSPC